MRNNSSYIFPFPAIDICDSDDNETLFLSTNMKMSISDSSTSNNILTNERKYYNLLDVLVDNILPNSLRGKSLAERYKKLSSGTDSEIILKEIYRVMKIVRNAAEHERDSINIDENNNYSISYTYRRTLFELKIKQDKLVYIFMIILIFANLENKINSYILGFLRTYYDIIREVLSIKDEFVSSLPHLHSITEEGLRLKAIRRSRVVKPIYWIEDNFLKIKRKKMPRGDNINFPEYLVLINNKLYLIPEEILISDEDKIGKIKISKISEWEYDDIICNIFRKLSQL